MKKTTQIILSMLLALLAGQLVTRPMMPQDRGNPPLMTARNSLSQADPYKVPFLQPGYRNPEDIWLLYAPEFDALSASAQFHLLLKYGVLDVGPMQHSDSKLVSRYKFERSRREIGENVQVNDPALDVGLRIQNETSSATSGSNIVVGYNDLSMPGFGSSISYSNDGGRTWQQTVPPLYPSGRGAGDPVMAAGPDGVFYHAVLAFNAFQSWTIGVTKSNDGGATWSPLVNATASMTSPSITHDFEKIAVDTTDSPFRGNVYLSWNLFAPTPGQQGIYFARSINGGETWSQARLITRSDPGRFIRGSYMVVGPGGEVYVCYSDLSTPGIWVIKSRDGGQTFGPPVLALRDTSLRESFILSGIWHTGPNPRMAVDTSPGPNRGTIYIVTETKPLDLPDNRDVVLVKSTDGGSNWSRPVRVHDDETDTDQFQPSLAVAPDGTLGIMWYDRRNDPLNNVLIDVYMTTSTDGGDTFSPNRRVTSANWMVAPPIQGAYHGDYNYMSAGDLGFVLNWGDERSGTDPDVYVAVLPTEQASWQPSDFLLATRTLAKNLLAGSSESFTIDSASLRGFEDEVRLEVAPEYPGLSYRLSSHTIEPGDEFTLTVEATSDAALRTYPITIIGRAGHRVRATNLRLSVYNPKELSEPPRAVSDIHDLIVSPNALIDEKGDLHIVSGVDTNNSLFAFRVLNYMRYRGDKLVAGTTILATHDPLVLPLSSPGIGIDGQGNITVVWAQVDSATRVRNIFMSRSTDQGATFATPMNITRNTDIRISLSLPVLAVSETGAINVVYVELNGMTGFQNVLFTQSTDKGETFSPRVNVSNSQDRVPTASATSPVIALDQSGAIGIAYLGVTRATRADVFFSRSINGVNFSTPGNISRTNTESPFTVNILSPSIAIDRSGNINVAYIKTDRMRNEQNVYSTRSTDKGRTFTDSINASRVTIERNFPLVSSIGTDQQGNIGIAWKAVTPSPIRLPFNVDTFFCKSTDGGRTFSIAINISNSIGQRRSSPPPMVLSHEGKFEVLWEDSTSGNNQIVKIALGDE